MYLNHIHLRHKTFVLANLFYVNKFVDSNLAINWIIYFIIVIVLFVGDHSLSQNFWKGFNTHFPQDRYTCIHKSFIRACFTKNSCLLRLNLN